MRKIFVVAVLAGLAGCSGSDHMTGDDANAALQCTTPTDPHPVLGTPFWVHARDAATIASEGLTLDLQEVVEDSRCPQPLLCPRAGTVEIRVGAQHPPDGARDLALSTADATSGTATFAGYDVRLLDVQPYPMVDRPPTPSSDYCVQLRVDPH